MPSKLHIIIPKQPYFIKPIKISITVQAKIGQQKLQKSVVIIRLTTHSLIQKKIPTDNKMMA